MEELFDAVLEFGLNRVPIWIYLTVSLAMGAWAAKGWMMDALDGETSTYSTFKKWVQGLVAIGGLVGSVWTGCVNGFGSSLAAVENDPARAIIDAKLPNGQEQRFEEWARRLTKVLEMDGAQEVRYIGCDAVMGTPAAIIEVAPAWKTWTRDAKLDLVSAAQRRWRQVTGSFMDTDAPVYISYGQMGLIAAGSHRGAGLHPWTLDDANAPRLFRGPYDIHIMNDDDRLWLKKHGIVVD